jgi:ketosteroid isomerase-like protein
MNMGRSAREVVEAFISAFPITDEAIASMLVTEDFTVRQPRSLPYGGDFVGPKAYVELIRQVQETWSDLTIHSSVMVHEPGSDLVIIVMSVSGRGRHGSFTMPVADMCRVRDGKLCEMVPMYHDTKWLHDVHFGTSDEAETAFSAN